EQRIFDLTDPITFAPLTGHLPKFIANGLQDTLVTPEGGQRLQAAFAEPKSLHWFDGNHGDSPAALIEQARAFLAQHLGAAVPVAR
ncbi:MAG: hypothetical protein O2888_01485, partial [Chloroflexi bacterium]|nr:hypothetical protein [Chloroflexota bacterium]